LPCEIEILGVPITILSLRSSLSSRLSLLRELLPCTKAVDTTKVLREQRIRAALVGWEESALRVILQSLGVTLVIVSLIISEHHLLLLSSQSGQELASPLRRILSADA